MTDKQIYKELEKFANSHTLSKDIKVTITRGSVKFEAVNGEAKYEDAVLLSNIVLGAEHYLMWKRRNKKWESVSQSQETPIRDL